MQNNTPMPHMLAPPSPGARVPHKRDSRSGLCAVQAVEEKLNPIEVSINTWVAPTYKLEYSPDLHDEILHTFKPILEEWSGEPTQPLCWMKPPVLLSPHPAPLPCAYSSPPPPPPPRPPCDVPGIADLEPTGLSGIRFYQPGATIAEHVDMADLNVVSALINIDQMVRLMPSLHARMRVHHATRVSLRLVSLVSGPL